MDQLRTTTDLYNRENLFLASEFARRLLLSRESMLSKLLNHRCFTFEENGLEWSLKVPDWWKKCCTEGVKSLFLKTICKYRGTDLTGQIYRFGALKWTLPWYLDTRKQKNRTRSYFKPGYNSYNLTIKKSYTHTPKKVFKVIFGLYYEFKIIVRLNFSMKNIWKMYFIQ